MGTLWTVEMNIGFISFVFIIIATGTVLVCLVSVISVLTAFISFKKGIDPDDIVAPVVTTLGDTFGIIFLFVFIGVVIP
jgi:mgtE-like transporter